MQKGDFAEFLTEHLQSDAIMDDAFELISENLSDAPEGRVILQRVLSQISNSSE